MKVDNSENTSYSCFLVQQAMYLTQYTCKIKHLSNNARFKNIVNEKVMGAINLLPNSSKLKQTFQSGVSGYIYASDESAGMLPVNFS